MEIIRLKDGLNIGTGSWFQYKLNPTRNTQLAAIIDPFKMAAGIICQNLWYCTEIGNHNTINQASSNGDISELHICCIKAFSM